MFCMYAFKHLKGSLLQPITRKEIELQPVEVPSVIILERPFLVTNILIALVDAFLNTIK